MKYFMALDSILTKVQPVHLWALLGYIALPLFPQTVSVTNMKALALANSVLLLLELQEGVLRYSSCHCPLYFSRDLCHKERQTRWTTVKCGRRTSWASAIPSSHTHCLPNQCVSGLEREMGPRPGLLNKSPCFALFPQSKHPQKAPGRPAWPFIIAGSKKRERLNKVS